MRFTIERLKPIIFIYLLIAEMSLASTASTPETVTVKSPEDLKNLIAQNNYDIKILYQRAKQAQAIVDGVKGAYYPVLSTDINYSDDQKEPTSNFQPARIKNEHFGISLLQRTPIGINGSIGFANDRTELFQSEPPNSMLPYPETYKQPALYVNLEVDILEDFLGYISQKQWDQVELDKEVADMQISLAQEQLYLTSSSLFWNLQAMEEMKILVREIINRLKQLESDTIEKSKRHIANPGDVYKLKASISKRELDILAIDKNINTLERAIFEMVSASGSKSIKPSKKLSDIQADIIECEDFILNQGEEIRPSWSKQFNILETRIERANLEQKILNRKTLPDIKLFAKYSQTGTDADKDDSYTEMLHGERPQLIVGINLTHELSPSLGKSARTLGEVELQHSKLAYEKFFHESETLYLHIKEKTTKLKEEDILVEQAIHYEDGQMVDINRRYKQGRVSLFELIQEEGSVLQTQLIQKELWAKRIENVYQFLTHFDNLECRNITTEVRK